MEDPRITELVRLARSSPQEAIGVGEHLLVQVAADDALASEVERALCEAARVVRPIGESIGHGRAAVSRAEAADRPDLRREAHLTLSGSLYLGGDVDGALRAIDAAADGATGVFAARTGFQRATVLAREGRADEALAGYRKALPVFVAADDIRFQALCHQNAGNVELESGRIEAALAHFTEAARLFRELGLRVGVVAIEHNLGRAHGYAGRVALALHHLDTAERELDDLVAGSWEIKASKCEILLQAGFHADALALAQRAATELAGEGLELERAEAQLWWSVAALESGDPEGAEHLAGRAGRAFRRQQRERWALQADALALRCALTAGRTPPVTDAAGLARELGAAGQVFGAAWAWSAVAVTDPVAALDGLTALAPATGSLPLELRLVQRHLTALAHHRAGRLGPALAATRDALADGRRHRASLASSDAIAGASAQFGRLLQLGLDLRVERGRPDAVLRWVEQTRSAIVRPLPPTHRSAEVELLTAELRRARLATRTAPAGEVAHRLREQARLQRRLTVADRVSRRGRPVRARGLPRHLRAALVGRTVIQYAESGGRLLATVADGDGLRLLDLGPAVEASTLLVKLTRAAERFAVRPDERTAARLERAARAAGKAVLPPTTDLPTTVAPLARHLSVPWTLLPTLSDREVAVAPSLLAPPPPPEPADRGVGVALGPGLLTGAGEVERIVETHRTAGRVVDRLVTPEKATIAATLDLLARVDLAHLASHGHRNAGDPRFAGLELIDGDLTTFDLEGLERAPATVVFSGCDAGVLQPLPGEEAVGLAGALFQRGSTAVVAAVCPLPDDGTTAARFVDLHHQLALGRVPAEALAHSRRTAPDPVAATIASLLTCFRLG